MRRLGPTFPIACWCAAVCCPRLSWLLVMVIDSVQRPAGPTTNELLDFVGPRQEQIVPQAPDADRAGLGASGPPGNAAAVGGAPGVDNPLRSVVAVRRPGECLASLRYLYNSEYRQFRIQLRFERYTDGLDPDRAHSR